METNTGQTSLQIPFRFDYWLSCVDTWTPILQHIGADRMESIEDICCGWSPKLELALSRTKFAGSVTCVDRSLEVLTTHKKLSETLYPSFAIQYRVDDILSGSAIRELPDLIIGNHILDDLLLGAYCVSRGISQVDAFRSPETMSHAWISVFSRPVELRNVIEKLSHYLIERSTAGTIIALAQYEGYQDKLYGHHTAKQTGELLGYTRNHLMSTGAFTDITRSAHQTITSIPYPYFGEKDLLILSRTTRF